MRDVLLTLLSLSLSGSLLAVILLAVRRVVGGRLPKAFWYYAWLLVLLRLAVPVGLGIRLPQPVPAAPEGTRQEAVLPEAPDQAEQEAPAAGSDIPAVPPATQPDQAPAPPERPLSPAVVLSALWLLGAAGFFLWHLAAYGRFARRVGRSLVPPPAEALALFETLRKGRRVRLAASSQVDTPMLIGLLRPVVVLPLGQPVGAAVLRHELTHCRRYDVLYKWLVVLVTALHWFNPLVHWMGRRMALDCELSCDEAVLSALPPEERVDYGELLLALAARRRLPAGVTATTLCEEKKQLKARLQGILGYRTPTRGALCEALALGLALACCACGVDFPKVWHQKCRMCFTEEDLLYTLGQLVAVLEYRKGRLAETGCPNLDAYNEATGDNLPRLVFACDEVAELLDKTGRNKEEKEQLGQIENRLATLARLGRAFGIHLILATQRPDANILPGQIKNNLDFRVCGRADNVLSQIILDNTSAADQIPKDARGRFITGDGTVFQGYLFDEKQL